MRNVRIYIQSKNIKKVIKSSATTWAALRNDIRTAIGDGFDPNMKYTLVETRATLEQDDAVIPSSDVSILGTPVSVKSGSRVNIDMAAVIASLNEKINDALFELKSEIENGDFDKEEDDSFADLEQVAKKIK